MATTFVEYTGDGNATKQFSFPSYKESDIKVRVDEVLKTTSTHYNITSYTTTGGGNVVFTSGNIPTSPAKIRIYRDTEVDAAKATYTAGSSVKAGDLNNNNTQLLYKAQEEQLPQQIHSYDIDDDAVITTKIKNDAITSDKIADDQINSEHYVSGSIDLEHMSANSVDSDQYVDGSVDRVHLEADIIDSTKLADNAVNSEHYVDLSIDTEHIANENVTTAKLAADAVTSAKLADNSVNTEHIVADAVNNSKLADNSVHTEQILDDQVTTAKLVNASITTDKLANTSVTTAKLAADAVTNAKLADDSVHREQILNGEVITAKLADNAVTTVKIADNSITDAKIAGGSLDNRYYTETELDAGQLDNRYYTETESDARYFNISTGDTIKDGDTFPDNDTTIATTAAINDRIIDLVDDVGGFLPIANETSFPTSNPDVNNNSGTVVSVKTIGSTRTPSSGTVTIANGAGTGNTVTIANCGGTVLTAGFGIIVETTSTLHTYNFHRLVPKATEITTVAGISSNITTVANNTSNINAVAADASDIGIVAADGTDIGLVAGSISNVNTTAGSIANVNTTAGNITNVNNVGNNISNVNSVHSNASNINSAVSNASNINSAVSNASNINTVAGSISNVNTVGGAISNVNTTATNIADVNNFAGTYQIASSNPSTDGSGNSLAAGDLYFNTGSNELRVYNGSTWQGGVTATGNLAGLGTNSFTGNQTIQNTAPSLAFIDTDSNSDFSIFGSQGEFRIRDQTNTTNRITIASDGTTTIDGNLDCSSGVDVTGNITVSGNVDGRDVAADGTKLDGISSSAIANVVQDTTPQLGGNLDVQSNKITTASSNTNVQIEPNGTGVVEIRGAGGYDGTLQLNCSQQSHGIKLRSPSHSAGASYTLTFPNSIVNNGALKTDSNGNLSFGLLTNTNINASAAIAGTKIAPDFGSQAITTTGTASVGNSLSITGADPVIHLTDSNHNSDYSIFGNGGVFTISDSTNTADRFEILSDGTTNVNGNLNVSSGADVTGNITVTGTVDGIDIAAFNTQAQSFFNGNGNGVLTNGVTATTQSASDNTTKVATTAYVTTATSDVAANTAKVTNATHTGDVTGSTSLTIANDAVTGAKIADDSIDSEHYVDGSIDTAHIANDAVDATKLANTSVSAGSYGSSTAIPAITVDAQGRITAASTNAVNTTTNLGASAGTGTILITSSTGSNVTLPEATSSNAGVMSTAHHDKLDGIAASAIDGSALNASNLSSGTIPDARFPATLPVADGSNLTGLASTTAGGAIYENSQTISATHTIPSGSNGMSAGPVTVNNGVTLTISTGSTYTIV